MTGNLLLDSLSPTLRAFIVSGSERCELAPKEVLVKVASYRQSWSSLPPGWLLV